MKIIAVRGNEEYGKEIIQYLEMMGGVNEHGLQGVSNNQFYYINVDGIIDVDSIAYANKDELIPIERVLQVAGEWKPVYLSETGDFPDTINPADVVHPNFPRMMWVWNKSPNQAVPYEVHGHIPTVPYQWIGYKSRFKHASDTDPRISELTIEEAEAKYNIKIKRP